MVRGCQSTQSCGIMLLGSLVIWYEQMLWLLHSLHLQSAPQQQATPAPHPVNALDTGTSATPPQPNIYLTSLL